MKLIGLCAGKRCGKDTFADYIIEKQGYVKYGFADPLKEACRHIFLFNDEQLYGEEKEEMDDRWGITPRQALQQVGTQMFRQQSHKLFPNSKIKAGKIWVQRFKLWYKEQIKINPNIKVILSDIRFQDEADAITELGGSLISIKRNTKMIDTHLSETGIKKIKTDYTITNNLSLDNYYYKIDLLMKTIA